MKRTNETKVDLTYHFWLVFSRDGSMRFARNEPGTGRDERAMLVSATLPKSLWVQPTLSATITVTADDHEPRYDLDLTAAGDALRSSLGVDIDLRVVPAISEGT